MTAGSTPVAGRFRAAADLLEEGLRERAYTAAVLLVSRGEGVLFRASAGEARPSSVFDIASVTKPLVASLFFVLAGQGKLSLDGRISELLPVRSTEPGAGDATFRQLLSHTAGLPAYRPLYADLREAERREGRRLRGTAEGRDRILEAVLSLPLAYAPGTGWEYSDLGYMLVGRAVELAAFSPLDLLLRKELTGPLGMRDTGYLPLSAMSECETGRIVSTGHSAERGREKIGEVDDENAAAMGGIAGHAGIFSTADDLFALAREVLRARRGQGRVLAQESALAMTRRVESPPGCPRTPGWDTPTPGAPGGSQAGSRFHGESVGHLGYSGCSLWIDLVREVGVVLLTNRIYYGEQNDGLKVLRPRLHDAVLEAVQEHA